MPDVLGGAGWTHDRLAELREYRYRPSAWADFLRSSFDRAAATRDKRPALGQQVGRWMLCWLLATAAARSSPLTRWLPIVPLRRDLALWVTTTLMLRWHIGMVESEEGDPRDRLSSADAMTLVRVWLAPRVRRAGGSRPILARLLLIAAASDVADGRLARRRGETRLGRDLDRISDSVFLMAAVTAAREAEAIDPWAARALALRLAAGTAYPTYHYFRRGVAPTNRKRAGRLTGALSFAGLILAVTGSRHGSAIAGSGAIANLFVHCFGMARNRSGERLEVLSSARSL